jgi:hypothetical protein
MFHKPGCHYFSKRHILKDYIVIVEVILVLLGVVLGSFMAVVVITIWPFVAVH